MSDTKPTSREIAAVSARPARFKRMYATAIEVLDHAERHNGQLPAFAYELTDRKWDDLSDTLRELDELAWLRKVAA